jgi:hypothetical protein
MDPLPRFPELDRQLAEHVGTPGLQNRLEVYGDWLVEHGHPLGEWITDDRRARGGDEDARRRGLQRRFQTCDPMRFPSFEFGWTAGVVARTDGVAREYERHATDALDLFLQPWLGLVSEVRIELTGEPGGDGDLLASLAVLPPCVGRLALCDPRMPGPQTGPGLDLSYLDLPHLRDLRLRIERVLALPPRLSSLRRLELCVHGPVALPALPQLRELHLWTGVGQAGLEALEATLSRAPQLEVLGLHHPGPAREALPSSLPRGLRELALCVPRVSRDELQQLRARLPQLQVVRLPWVDVQGPLSAPFVAEPLPDQPVYVL